MKTFIKKHLGTLVIAPAFTIYILLLPAKNEVHKVKEDVPDSHSTDLQIKKISFAADHDLTAADSWIFRFESDQ
jgi:hypothetical protein